MEIIRVHALHVIVALHSEGLTGTSLAIGEKGGVESFDHFPDHERYVALLKDFFLGGTSSKYLVKPVHSTLLPDRQ